MGHVHTPLPRVRPFGAFRSAPDRSERNSAEPRGTARNLPGTFQTIPYSITPAVLVTSDKVAAGTAGKAPKVDLYREF